MQLSVASLFITALGLTTAYDEPDMSNLTPVVFANFFYDVEELEELQFDNLRDIGSRKVFTYDKEGKLIKEQSDTGTSLLPNQHVSHDPRNVLGGGDTSIGILGSLYDPSKIDPADQEYWFNQAVKTWLDIPCGVGAPLTTVEVQHPNYPGFVETLITRNEYLPHLVQADITIVGFKTGEEFPYFAMYPKVLGTTVTIGWMDEFGELTDIDNDGRYDSFATEIYFNADAPFTTDPDIADTRNEDGKKIRDFPSIIIHEVGHSLGLDHFGNISVKNGELFMKPRAVMNGIYKEMYRDLSGHDKAAYCHNWADRKD